MRITDQDSGTVTGVPFDAGMPIAIGGMLHRESRASSHLMVPPPDSPGDQG